MDSDMDDVVLISSDPFSAPEVTSLSRNDASAPTRQGRQADDNDALFVDSDQEAILGGGRAVLRRRGGKKGKRHASKPVRLSHQDSSSIIGEDEHLLWAPTDRSEIPNTPPPRTPRDSPGLFVSEDEEEAIVLQGQTTLNRTKNIPVQSPYMAEMDALKRARAIKAEIENNISVLNPQDKKTGNKHVEDDPENQLIKTLRQEQSMSWNDIANYLNQERRNRGEAASFTDAAVYSRFVRNAPRIAAAVGEVGFDPKDYMHLRNPNQFAAGEGTGLISKAGKKRVKNYDNAKELEANMRKVIKVDDNAELETAEKTEQLMQAVAKVERNFWKFVADEMERSTTKFYPPNALASRYHAI